MSQKLIIGALALLILSVIGLAVEDQVSTESSSGTDAIPVVQRTDVAQDVPDVVEVTREPQVMAEDTVGEVWNGEGTLTVLEDFGFTLELADFSSVYVELGPPDFWQGQGVPLAVGDTIQVSGWNNGDQIHARVVTTSTGQIQLRTETGQPLWSGGTANSQQATASNETAGSGQTQFQVAAEEWFTLSGIVTRVSNGGVSMQTPDGAIYKLQMGQPNFWKSQGVTLNVSDEIEVLGFWMNNEFMVGDITKTATGEHIILRDPNGRQLWGGPGRNGNNQTNPNGQ